MIDPPSFPSRADLAAWLGTPDPATPGDLWDIALEVAREQQSARCVMHPYTVGLHAAALRRAARLMSARGFTLGSIDSGEMPMFIPRMDAEIEIYENPHRIAGIA